MLATLISGDRIRPGDELEMRVAKVAAGLRAKGLGSGDVIAILMRNDFPFVEVGNCFDNAVIESFFGTLKAEYFHLDKPDSIDALEAGVHDYVHYYNHERIKLGLQGLSPVEYRLRGTALAAVS